MDTHRAGAAYAAVCSLPLDPAPVAIINCIISETQDTPDAPLLTLSM